jgi:PAS domain S-box-containing protein
VQWEPESPLTDERLRVIEDVSSSLGGALELNEVLARAIGAVVPSLADLAVLVGGGEEAELFELRHVDAAEEPRARLLVQQHLHPLRRLTHHEQHRGRMFRWIPRLGDHTSRYLAGDQRIFEMLVELEVKSLIIVALRTGSETIGALALARTRSDEPYAAADLATAQVVARRIAVAVETARLRTTMAHVNGRTSLLQDALLKWTRVFHLAGWGAAIVDGSEHRIDIANPAFARMHGYEKPEDLVGRLFLDLVPLDRRAEVSQWARGAEQLEHPYESYHLKAGGDTFPVLVNATRLDDVGSFVFTVQDLSELKRTEERLRRAQRMEAVGRLAGGVAHEVNNMMTIILGFSDLLGRAPQLPDMLQRDVEEIRKAATRAGRITQQLLAFSRQQVLQPADLSINSVVEELVPVLRLMLPANIRIETRLAPFDGKVRADRAQLEQVLINLAFNARDAMPGGGTIRLATETRELEEETGRRLIGIPFIPGNYGLFSVIDTGHGMDRETLEQVFEPFFTTKPVGLGTGLGLATVYGIVKQSGGYVWVESSPGSGTTFHRGPPDRAGGGSGRTDPAAEARVRARGRGHDPGSGG